MVRVFHGQYLRSMRVVWLCEEMGIPYETVPCPLAAPKPPELLALNRAATVPVMTDGNLALTESVIMLEYLAETYGPTPLALKPQAPEYWDYRQMLVFGEATLTGPLNAIVATTFLAPTDQKQNFTAEVIRKSFQKRLQVVEQRLGDHAYVVGDAFTLADISVAYPIDTALRVKPFGLGDLVPPKAQAYAERLRERPAYQRMLQVT